LTDSRPIALVAGASGIVGAGVAQQLVNAGWRVVYTPFARLVHHESYTRQRDDSAEDMSLLAQYLKQIRFVEDPYFHPELDPKSPIPSVRPLLNPMPRQIISDYVERVLAAATP